MPHIRTGTTIVINDRIARVRVGYGPLASALMAFLRLAQEPKWNNSVEPTLEMGNPASN